MDLGQRSIPLWNKGLKSSGILYQQILINILFKILNIILISLRDGVCYSVLFKYIIYYNNLHICWIYHIIQLYNFNIYYSKNVCYSNFLIILIKKTWTDYHFFFRQVPQAALCTVTLQLYIGVFFSWIFNQKTLIIPSCLCWYPKSPSPYYKSLIIYSEGLFLCGAPQTVT